MKRFVFFVLAGVFSLRMIRADAADDLNKQGSEAFNHQDYAAASQAFEQIIKNYPSTTYLGQVQLKDGVSNYYLGNFSQAIQVLAPLAAHNAKPDLRPVALQYTGLAQFNAIAKLAPTDTAGRNTALAQTIDTLTDLITSFPQNDLVEDTLYTRSLAYFQKGDYASMEKDLKLLITQFKQSLELPDYELLLGKLYGVEMSQAINAGKSNEEVNALAQQALQINNAMSGNLNALVIGNEAAMDRGSILFALAGLDANQPEGYQKALAAFRQVKRKADLIPLQNQRIQSLQELSRNARQQGQNAKADALGLLIGREQQRLTDLQNAPDPVIHALVMIAQCYNQMKQPDEARTVVHRLLNAGVSGAEKQQIDFQLLLSYVIGGQVDKADQALTDYLGKHPGDTAVDGISFSLASTLMQKGDAAGALAQAQRSLKDFPDGAHEADAKVMEAQALTKLGRNSEATAIMTELNNDPKARAVANQAALTLAQTETSQGNLDGALASYQKVMDNPQASPEQAAAAMMGGIAILKMQGKYDQVIQQVQVFLQKFPNDANAAYAMVQEAVALDSKKDPGAIPLLQQIPQKYPKDQFAPYALFYIVGIYAKEGKVDAMAEATQALEKTYPEALNYISIAAQTLGAAYEKQKKFVLATAQYQILASSDNPDLAASFQNKIGSALLASARALGPYQSMQQQAEKDQARQQVDAAEKAYLVTLTNFPGQLSAVGEAINGLIDTTLQRRSWGLMTTDAEMAKYFSGLTAQVTMPEMQARLNMARIGLIFRQKNAESQYPAALEGYKKILADNPSLVLTRQESSQFGKLLIFASDYQRALDVFNALLSQAAPNDEMTLADANYGLGAAYLAQGDVEQAKTYFLKLKSLSNGASWYPDIMSAEYGLGLAAEKAGDTATAKQEYGLIMRNNGAKIDLKAEAMLGYGRALEKEGKGIQSPGQQDTEFAVHYYQQVDIFYDGGLPEKSAEGLYAAGQILEKNSNTAEAKAQYQNLVTTYGTTAPDWATKAQDRLKQLGP